MFLHLPGNLGLFISSIFDISSSNAISTVPIWHLHENTAVEVFSIDLNCESKSVLTKHCKHVVWLQLNKIEYSRLLLPQLKQRTVSSLLIGFVGFIFCFVFFSVICFRFCGFIPSVGGFKVFIKLRFSEGFFKLLFLLLIPLMAVFLLWK